MATSLSNPVPTSGFMAWCQAHPMAILAMVFFVGMAFPFYLRRDSEWDEVYIRAAVRLQGGDNVYNGTEGYLYPPFMAWFAIPFTYLGPQGGRMAWYLVNVICLAGLFGWSWKLAGGTTIRSRIDWLIAGLGLALGFRYAVDALAHQQIDLLIAALVIGGCLALYHQRPWLAATVIGIAAGAKCTPLLWCPYLLWRRQWGPAIWLVAIALGVNLLPDLVQAPQDGGLWLSKWFSTYILPMQGQNPGAWGSDIGYNQSLSGAINRWLLSEWTWGADGFRTWEKADPIRHTTLKAILHGVELVLVGAAMYAMGRRVPTTSSPTAVTTVSPGKPRLALEYSVVLLLMVLLSPMSSKPHFCTMLLPGFALARQAVHEKNRLLWLVLFLAFAASALSWKEMWGTDMAGFGLWLGSVTWSASFLLGGCYYSLCRRPGEISPARSLPLAA